MATTPKISAFLIALVWLGFFAAIGATFIGNISSNYDNNFNESDISAFNKLDDLSEQVESYKESALDYKQKSGILDLVGDIFNQGYKTLKVMGSSLDIFYSLLFSSFNNSVYSIPSVEYLKTAIFLTVLILIVIAVIVRAVVKSDV
jgi:hypothetical protein